MDLSQQFDPNQLELDFSDAGIRPRVQERRDIVAAKVETEPGLIRGWASRKRAKMVSTLLATSSLGDQVLSNLPNIRTFDNQVKVETYPDGRTGRITGAYSGRGGERLIKVGVPEILTKRIARFRSSDPDTEIRTGVINTRATLVHEAAHAFDPQVLTAGTAGAEGFATGVEHLHTDTRSPYYRAPSYELPGWWKNPTRAGEYHAAKAEGKAGGREPEPFIPDEVPGQTSMMFLPSKVKAWLALGHPDMSAVSLNRTNRASRG